LLIAAATDGLATFAYRFTATAATFDMRVLLGPTAATAKIGTLSIRDLTTLGVA
jgi:hypothetical protein